MRQVKLAADVALRKRTREGAENRQLALAQRGIAVPASRAWRLLDVLEPGGEDSGIRTRTDHASRLVDYRFCRSLSAQDPQGRCLADQRQGETGRLTGEAQNPGGAFEGREGLLELTARFERCAERDQQFAVCAVELVLSLERHGSRRQNRLLPSPAQRVGD